MSSVVLYSYFRSSSTFRVRIALNLKEVSYDLVPIHLLKDGGQQNQESYRKINPMGEVPCLVHNGIAIGQSMAIIEYLEATFGGSNLFPALAVEAAQVRQVCEIINSGIQPIQNLKVLQKLQKDFKATEEAKSNWAKFWITDGFKALEKILKSTAGSYSFKNKISAADCFLIPQVFNANRYGVDMAQFPTIQRVYDLCMKLDAFVKAAPENQPDFESR